MRSQLLHLIFLAAFTLNNQSLFAADQGDAGPSSQQKVPPVLFAERHSDMVCRTEIPKIFHQIWIGPVWSGPTPQHEKWTEELRKKHPGWEYRRWDSKSGRDFLADNYSSFLPTYDSYDSSIKRADYLRYFILHHFGGVYLDFSFRCLENIEALLIGAQVVVGEQDPKLQSIGNAFMASIPKHPLWLRVFKELEGRTENPNVLEATGPDMLTHVILEVKRGSSEDICILDHAFLYPFSWEDRYTHAAQSCLLYPERCKEFFPKAHLVKIWSKSWGKDREQLLATFDRHGKFTCQQARPDLLLHGSATFDALIDGPVKINPSKEGLTDEKLSWQRAERLLSPDVESTLRDMGILIEESASGFIQLSGTAGRSMQISRDALQFAQGRLDNRYTTHRTKSAKIEDILRQAQGRGFSPKPSLIESIYNHTAIFGAHPHIVRELMRSDDPIIQYIAEIMYAPRREIGQRTVLLITTQGGGGHFAQAQAIESYLKSIGRKVELFLVEEGLIDPIKHLTDGKFSSNSRFNLIDQKRLSLTGKPLSEEECKKGQEALGKAVYTLRALANTDNVLDVLSEKLRNPKYSAVIDNLPHWRNLESASIENGVPHFRWATDFDVWHGLADSYQRWHFSFGRIMLTSHDKAANKNLTNPLRVAFAGYPLRPEIGLLNHSEIGKAKTALGFKKSDTIVSVMMGSQGKAELQEIIDDFASQVADIPESWVLEQIHDGMI